MSNRDIHVCRNYAEAVFRGVIEPLPSRDFKPDWGDHPSFFKFYEDVERLALPLEDPAGLISMTELLKLINTPQEQRFTRSGLTTDELATMLYFAHGILNRRLRINRHIDQKKQNVLEYNKSSIFHSRGTASGGGLYPTEIYWACGSGSPVTPGLYHYANAHHAMEQLLVGDVTSYIQSAVFEHPAALHTNQFLLITLNFWKNAYKYNSFSYHVVTQDLGALLCSLWFMALGFHIDWQPIFWYQDEALNKLLGLHLDYESVCAVVPLPVSYSVLSSEHLHDKAIWSHPEKDSGPSVNKPSFQRSKRVRTFELNTQTHRSTLITNEPRPQQNEVSRASVDETYNKGDSVLLPLPALERLDSDLLETFQKRRSSFGAFTCTLPLSSTELATLLYSGSIVRDYGNDLKPANCPFHFTRSMVFVNNVQGVERGAYAYEAQTHSLRTICKGDMTLFLQENFALRNYSMAETGAVIAIVGDLENMLEVYGNRGYRLLNAEAGLVTQSMYMVSTAMSFACGAVLGFNNVALNTMLGLDGTGQKTLIFVLIGHENRNIGDINYRLV